MGQPGGDILMAKYGLENGKKISLFVGQDLSNSKPK